MKKYYFILALALGCKQPSEIPLPPVAAPECQILGFNDLPIVGPDIFPYRFEYDNDHLLRMKTFSYTLLGMVPSSTLEVTYDTKGLPSQIKENKDPQDFTVEELSFDAAQRLTGKKIVKTSNPSGTKPVNITVEKQYHYTTSGALESIHSVSHYPLDNYTLHQQHTFQHLPNGNISEIKVVTSRSDQPDYQQTYLTKFLEYDQNKNPLRTLKIPFESLHIGTFSTNNWLKFEGGYIVDGIYTRNAFSQRHLEYDANAYPSNYASVLCH